MALNTILIDFSVEKQRVTGSEAISTLIKIIKSVLREYLEDLHELYTTTFSDSTLLIYKSEQDTLTSIRVFTNGFITINIEYFKHEDKEPLLTFDTAKQIERDVIEQSIGVKRSAALVPIKRCVFARYLPSSDERLLEYDIDELVFEAHTEFQKVQIMHSINLGNMLVLDDLQNISEKDLIYTETLMARGQEDYRGKEICILGGGDGALLYELLQEKPKFVVMLEIDEVVMKACAKHMRSICGDVLDNYSMPNYEIVVGDCTKTLEEYIKVGRKFDYVFGDLTDIPISTDKENSKKIWEFIAEILDISFKVLKPDGKFMTHGNGISCVESLKLYEDELNKVKPAVQFTKTTAFVPSFLEEWVFYQITFANN